FFETLKQSAFVNDRYFEAGKPPLGAQEGAAAARQLLEARPDTDAVMCVADSVAFGAITAFQRAGIDVPNDIAVAGFGAYDLGACSVPPITTIEPNAEEIGELAGKMIGDLLEPRDDRQVLKHTGKLPKLVLRGSTTV
ncbi:MAG: substrate-binding domain-containing protein, partial [Pseudomonadota bacterium]